MARRRRLTREESKALTRMRLIAAAREVFLERGFHGASIEAIAEQAGYTIGALYSNFAGKSELFVAVFEDYVAARAKEVERALGAAVELDDQTAGAALQWIEKLDAEPEWFPVFIEFWSHAVRDEQLSRRFAISLGAMRVALGRIVEQRAAEHGLELPLPPEHLGTAIKALGNGIALERLADPDGVPAELFGDILALLVRGLEAGADRGARQGDEADADADQLG